ncbi:Protein translocase subunit SecD [hydrothermal vent metagenome]|uniref:Protein translocase subunit SecD n=1 Tax=hydrothermal vent metagenome TaxID=652676 RepID=A0A3B0ZY57_9ZZZZ
MINHYPWWKYLLIVLVLAVGVLYALPNIYGTDPALQISASKNAKVDIGTQQQVEGMLKGANIPVKEFSIDDGKLITRFNNVEDQLKANDFISCKLGEDYTVALNLTSAAPQWLESSFNALPMYLGLDLRGGLHFLMQVEMDEVVKQSYTNYASEIRSYFRTDLRKKDIRYKSVRQTSDNIVILFDSITIRDKAFSKLKRQFQDLDITEGSDAAAELRVAIKPATLVEKKKNALTQNITTLRNRVNELGVSEPVITQQGVDRIVVQLPGIQDSARAKEILSATATLEFYMQSDKGDVSAAIAGRVPSGTRLYYQRNTKNPVLLKKRLIIRGSNITNAGAGYDQSSGSPSVNITLDGEGGKRMAQTTKKNLKKPMAVVFIEYKTIREKENCTDKDFKIKKTKIEEVINIATIQGVFSKNFQITGLDSQSEASDLALLLRAGALVAPISIVEERTIGPSLGKDNIKQGTMSVVIGLLLVIVFMIIWYRGFGAVATLALSLNLVLIIAVLSMMQATLTMPGIAGIVLTIGMAVDANVLIFERIREELRNGNTPQASIKAGYAKAMTTIADANITTLIAAVVLFIFGTGSIQGFAITLSIGILTSMFTAIMGTRAVVNLFVSGKRIKTLSI